MAESFSREKLRHARRRKKVDEKSCVTFLLLSCVTPAGTSDELDVQNEWEESTHTHSGHQVRWTYYQPGSHRSKVTQDFTNRSPLVRH